MSVLIELRPEAGPALIVGGGVVATRKAQTMASGGFHLTVIAPVIADKIRELPLVTLRTREFEANDLAGSTRWAIVMACTDNRAVNQQIGELARAANIPVLVADRQAESTVFTPAIIQDGELRVAVSTGSCPVSMTTPASVRLSCTPRNTSARVGQATPRAVLPCPTPRSTN